MIAGPLREIEVGDLWKKPRHEIHGTNRHAHAKYHAGQGALGRAFAKGKHESSNHDRH
jgi:hypothetical protein